MENDEDLVARVQIQGTTFIGIYEVVDTKLMLYSPDFGEHAEVLNGQSAEEAAAALLTIVAEAAMRSGETRFIPDDETTCRTMKPPEARGSARVWVSVPVHNGTRPGGLPPNRHAAGAAEAVAA